MVKAVKRGRPPMDPNETRYLGYRLLMNEEEFYILDKLSKAKGVTKAEVLREGIKLVEAREKKGGIKQKI